MDGFAEIFRERLIQNGLSGFTDDALAKSFEILYGELCLFNAHTNITAIKSLEDTVIKHFADSLTLSSRIPKDSLVIDVGCGGGFPSLPLAIVRPDIKITAVDSVSKKLRFIGICKEKLGLCNIDAISCRAEELSRDAKYREKFDVCTARAVAPLSVLSELCLPFVKVGGTFLAMKGRGAEEEVENAKNAVTKLGGRTAEIADTPLLLNDEKLEHKIIGIEKIKKTDIIYPRKYSAIISRPL